VGRNLFLRERAILGNVGEHGWVDIPTILAIRFAADDQPALALANRHVAHDLLELVLVDDRRDLRRRILGGPTRSFGPPSDLASTSW
jgi:hypothetical protein